MSYFNEKELMEIGFGGFGENVKISKKASFYNSHNIFIGDNTRIDDFCVLSAGFKIKIGRNVHIAIFSSLIGKEEIAIDDFVNISSRVSIYSSNDDYSGEFMTNPTIDSKYTNITHGPIKIGKHAIIGSGSIILPNIIVHEGVCIGALSLIKEDCDAFGVYTGVPAKQIKVRSRKLLELEKELHKDEL